MTDSDPADDSIRSSTGSLDTGSPSSTRRVVTTSTTTNNSPAATTTTNTTTTTPLTTSTPALAPTTQAPSRDPSAAPPTAAASAPASTPASTSASAPAPASASASASSTPAATASASASASSIQPDVASAPKRQQTRKGPRSLNMSGSNSPLSSRDTSPTRQRTAATHSAASKPGPGRLSRKSSHDVSPNRGTGLAGASSAAAPTVPSAAAIQRALSNTNIPQLPPTASQDSTRVPRPAKAKSANNSGDSTPHWPISPRLKSPPPSDTRSRSRRDSLRAQQQPKKPEPTNTTNTPSIFVQCSSPGQPTRVPVKDDVSGSEAEEPQLTMKPSNRGASGGAPKLATVQESSVPSTPSKGHDGSLLSSSTVSTMGDDDHDDVTSSKITEDLSARLARNMENGSDGSVRNKPRMQEQRSASTQRPTAPSAKASFSSLHAVKSRSEAPLRNMTVETETVPSVAQTTIANQDRSVSGRGEGSLRLKPSNETIRPRKNPKQNKRKAPSIHSGTGRSPNISYHHHHPSRSDYGPHSATASSFGSPVSYRSVDDRSLLAMSSPSPDRMRRPPPHPTFFSQYSYSTTNTRIRKASSKSDVFEHKVASEVNEADSSDSEATFIYESNPPEHQPHRSRQHHHSRTPSMTSIASLHDPRLAIRNEHKNPDKKPSMKFPNPYNLNNGDYDGDRSDGTVRAGSTRAGTSRAHHHIGRHGPGRGGLGHIIMDSDPSMSQSSRIRAPSSRHPSQPNSPRFQAFNVVNGFGNGNIGNGTKKHGELSAYDLDTENVADDERTSLLPIRSPRGRTPRRPNSATLRALEHRHRTEGSWCRRFAGCLVAIVIIMVVAFTSVGVVFASTKTLIDVEIHEIKNVVASQEEIILDLVVGAVNPNIVGVTIQDMNVSILAKSTHVGSDKWWREHGNGDHGREEDWIPVEDVEVAGVDEGTDPADEPRTMSLGRIFQFDSPLTFDGSFFNHHAAESVGEIRLLNPGNKTESGGSERWEEVLQYPFELIVRGTLKYQLPLSTREHGISVTATYYYDPDTEKRKLKMSSSNNIEKRDLSTISVTTAPAGRFDRRMLPLLQEGVR